MKPSSPRFLFLDALRGFAALSVLLHHLFISPLMFEPMSRMFPKIVCNLLFMGACGVDIFFVLSGFVIAHSLRNNPLTRQSLANFIIRRQIRLDLPYWAVVVASLFIVVLQNGASSHPNPLLLPHVVAAQFVYGQYLLGWPTLLGIAWTLCLEVQFYLIFVLVLCLGKALSGNDPAPAGTPPRATIVLMGASALVCLVAKFFVVNEAWFWSSWFYFAAGILTYWAWQLASPRLFWGVTFSFLAAAALTFRLPACSTSVFFFHLASYKALWVGLLTIVSIYVAANRGWLQTVSGGPIAQFLGRISYSIYLTHAVVLVLLEKMLFHLNGQSTVSPVLAVSVVALCLGVALLFHQLVEVPAMHFANRFKNASIGPRPLLLPEWLLKPKLLANSPRVFD